MYSAFDNNYNSFVFSEELLQLEKYKQYLFTSCYIFFFFFCVFFFVFVSALLVQVVFVIIMYVLHAMQWESAMLLLSSNIIFPAFFFSVCAFQSSHNALEIIINPFAGCAVLLDCVLVGTFHPTCSNLESSQLNRSIQHVVCGEIGSFFFSFL